MFVIQSGDPDNSGLHLGSLDSTEVDRIGNIESKAIFTSLGHLLYTRERALMAQRFDPERKALVGDPAMLAENVSGRTGIFGERAFSASADDKLAFWSGGALLSQPVWFSRSGEELETVGAPGLYDSVSLSPDGTKAAYERWDTHEVKIALWVHDFARAVSSPFSVSNDWGAMWSPDGKTIAYGSARHGRSDIYWKGYSTGQEERLLFKSDDLVGPTDWSADGRYIFLINVTRSEVGFLPVDPPGDPIVLLDSEFVERDARLSPNGRWMAFTSNESGAREVWIRSFPDLQNKHQVSTAGGSNPEWDPDGNELYYIGRDRRLMSVAIESDSKDLLGSPRALFPTRIAGHEFKRLYAVARNGEKFLMIVARGSSPPITLTLNWTAGLKP